MKKILPLLLALAMVLSAAACGKTEDSHGGGDSSVSDTVLSGDSESSDDSGNSDASESSSESADQEAEPEGSAESAPEDADQDNTSSEDTNGDEDSSSRDSDHYPITLTDQAGRKVTIEKEPQKLVSGYYIFATLSSGEFNSFEF